MGTLLNHLWWALTVNDVSTDGKPPYPDLSPICTSDSVDQIWSVVRSIFGRHPSWEILSINRPDRKLVGTARTEYLRFTDDLTIRIEDDPDSGGHIIYARSASRVGKGDLGVNARRLRKLRDELTDELSCDDKR